MVPILPPKWKTNCDKTSSPIRNSHYTQLFIWIISFRVCLIVFTESFSVWAKYCHLFFREKKKLPPASHLIHQVLHWIQIWIHIKINLSNVIYFSEMLENHYGILSSAFRIHLWFSSCYSISLHSRKPKFGTYLNVNYWDGDQVQCRTLAPELELRFLELGPTGITFAKIPKFSFILGGNLWSVPFRFKGQKSDRPL